MPRWTVDAPATYDFDRVDALRVRTIGGTVAVLSTGERACLDISAVTGQPLLVSHSDGILTVSYEDLSWDGLLGWLRPDRTSATITITVPKDCPVQLGVVTASADRVRDRRGDLGEERVRGHHPGRRDRGGQRPDRVRRHRGPGPRRHDRVQLGVR